MIGTLDVNACCGIDGKGGAALVDGAEIDTDEASHRGSGRGILLVGLDGDALDDSFVLLGNDIGHCGSFAHGD